jgi:hypothetical protein
MFSLKKYFLNKSLNFTNFIFSINKRNFTDTYKNDPVIPGTNIRGDVNWKDGYFIDLQPHLLRSSFLPPKKQKIVPYVMEGDELIEESRKRRYVQHYDLSRGRYGKSFSPSTFNASNPFNHEFTIKKVERPKKNR